MATEIKHLTTSMLKWEGLPQLKEHYYYLIYFLIANTTGDPCPIQSSTDSSAAAGPNQPLTLFSMRFCPFAHRVHLMLDHLLVPHSVYNIHLKEKPVWLTTYSLQGKVPALGLHHEPGTPFLTESLIVADYLAEQFGATAAPLYPATALGRANDRIWIERFAATVGPAFYRVAFVRPLEDDSVAKLAAGLEPIEAEVQRRGTRFFGGADAPGMLDLMLWPWFERFAALALMPEPERFVVDDAVKFPGLMRWRQAMLDDVEAVKKSHLAPEVHFEFMKSNHIGKPDYDMLVKK